jgi:hypothetical protein
MTAPLLLHVGYHKTATTWAQRRLFTPEHGFRQIAFHEEAFEHVVKPHGLRFSPEPMQKIIADARKTLEPGEVPVLSSEILSGHPFQGGHESDVYAERLKAIAPDARILISIRAQVKMIPSVYMQYLLRGGTMPYDQFFEGKATLGYFAFTPEHFEYDVLVAHYQKLFGADNVYVLTQESLQADMDGAVTALAAFAGATRFDGLKPEARARTGVSYPEYAAPVLRRINHVQTSTLQPRPVMSLGETPYGLYKLAGYALKKPPFSTLLKGRKPVSAYAKAHFTGRYMLSNAKLAKISTYPLDLSEYF